MPAADLQPERVATPVERWKMPAAIEATRAFDFGKTYHIGDRDGGNAERIYRAFPALSQSFFKGFERSPAHALQPLEETPFMRLGKVVDLMVLTPQLAKDKLVVCGAWKTREKDPLLWNIVDAILDAGSDFDQRFEVTEKWKTASGKGFRALAKPLAEQGITLIPKTKLVDAEEVAKVQAAGKTAVTEDEMANGNAIADRILHTPKVASILGASRFQVAAFAWLFGYPFKGLFDIDVQCLPWLGDLKVTTDAREEPFMRQIYEMKWHWQAYIYLELAKLCGYPKEAWFWIAAERDQPGVEVWQAGPKMLEQAEMEISLSVEKYGKIKELPRDEWPAYDVTGTPLETEESEKIKKIELPRFRQKYVTK